VTTANQLPDIAKQTSQILTLNLSASGTTVQQGETTRAASGRNIPRPNTTPYTIPGISISLAKILEEQAMRSRVEYEKR
jgi:hypothetical protein